MMKRLISCLLVILTVLSVTVSLASCGGEKEYPVTIGDVTISQEPENVVVLGRNLVDIISVIGYDGKVVGCSDDVDQEGYGVVANVGNAQSTDVSAIKQSGATLVLTQSDLGEGVTSQLKDEDIEVIVIDTAETQEQLQAVYITVGKILGGNVSGLAKATQEHDKLKTFLELIYESATTANPVAKTYCYLYLDEDNQLCSVNGSGWQSTVLSYSGALNVMENSESNVVDKDVLKLADPDYVFVNDEDVLDYLNSDLTLWDLKALPSNAQVIAYDDLTMQGYTSLTALENIIGYMYPEEEE